MADAGRVIAGSARGIRLTAPGEGTRPFGDRVKQTLFAILDPVLSGARVLDLFAGSGAAGIEALSRGAAAATFVEKDRAAIQAIEENLRRTRLGDTARVVRADVLDWLQRESTPVEPWQIVVLDAPYAEPELMDRAIERLAVPGVLAPGARVVAKHFWKRSPAPVVGLLASDRERRFGETALTFYRLEES